ncbi:hypothetical protein GCM10011391_37770 [Pullulanibacillus camelliae]|uniref:Uncharacterized protein n=1 Tax=Pullulanibacillus camelliae TaxID=1707096 RepID=A0A8J3E0X1_9BACL|nr:hypothetical protein [Pullulanibacillus camelliae]GGE55197.1 hypothetical protein GCM10011391_37770 [Pullulanibacillus camelliae]
MLKKIITALSSLAFIFFLTSGLSHAETLTQGKMFDAFQKQYKDANYDYKNGSLEINDVQTVNLDQPAKVKSGDKEVQINTIQMGMAHFKTVRDSIFFKDYNDYAYYSPENNLILTEADVGSLPQIKSFEKQHTSSVTLELGPIVGLCLLIVIVPLIFAYIWLRFKYNSLDFKLKNGQLGDGAKSH